MGRSLARAASRCSTVSEQIISRMAAMRSPSKNMCSVRHRPMPSAPSSRALAASWGVSALVRTFRRRILVGPAHDAAELAADGGVHGGDGAVIDVAGGAVQAQPVALVIGLAGQGRTACSPRPCRWRRSRRRSRCPCRGPQRRRGRSCRRGRSGCPARPSCPRCPRERSPDEPEPPSRRGQPKPWRPRR